MHPPLISFHRPHFLTLSVSFALILTASLPLQAQPPSAPQPTPAPPSRSAPQSNPPTSRPSAYATTQPTDRKARRARRRQATAPDLPPANYNPPEARQLTFAGNNGEAYFSPDATKLIFQSYDRKEHAHTQVYTLDIKSGRETRITHHDGDDTCTYFHPDGKSILYASTVDEVRESYAFRFFAPSWIAHHKALREAKAKTSRWSEKKRGKHRRKYAWSYKPYEIYRANLDGSQPQRLTHAPGYDAEGTYDATGRLIIFSSHRDGGDQELYLMNADGTNQRRLTWRKGNDGGAFISPSGKYVTWRSFDDKRNIQIMHARLQDGQLHDIRQLTFQKGIHWAPFWHPSEKWILYSANTTPSKRFSLFVVNTEGTCTKRLTYRNAHDVLPVFSPDGKQIAFTSRVGRLSQLYLMPFNPPTNCEDPRRFRTPESLLHFPPAPPEKTH